MSNPSKKPPPTTAEEKERIKKAVGSLGAALGNYKKDHPNWRIEVMISLLRWSLSCLKHHVEHARNKAITWEQPFLTVHYPVKWDWNASRTRGERYGRILCGDITHTSVVDKTAAVKTLSQIMVRVLNAEALSDLTSWVRFAKRGERYAAYLPPKLVDHLNSIKAKSRRQEVYEQIVHPFSIGAALVDYGPGELRNRGRIPNKAAKQLARISDLVDVPDFRFTIDRDGRKIEMSLVFQIHPLVTDHDTEKAYHAITVGLFFKPKFSDGEVVIENPARWSSKGRAEFWKELFRTLDTLAQQFFPNKGSQDYVVLTVNSQLKIPAQAWKPENRGNTMKAVTDALSLKGDVLQFNIQTDECQNRAHQESCLVCGFKHDREFTQFLAPDYTTFTLAGRLPDIARCVHRAHEKGFERLSTKDEELLRRCGSYRNPCKAFYDLRQSAAYKALFDTSRRGFIALRGFARKES